MHYYVRIFSYPLFPTRRTDEFDSLVNFIQEYIRPNFFAFNLPFLVDFVSFLRVSTWFLALRFASSCAFSESKTTYIELLGRQKLKKYVFFNLSIESREWFPHSTQKANSVGRYRPLLTQFNRKTPLNVSNLASIKNTQRLHCGAALPAVPQW